MTISLIAPRPNGLFTPQENFIALSVNPYLKNSVFLEYLGSVIAVVNQIIGKVSSLGSDSNFQNWSVCMGASSEMEQVVGILSTNPAVVGLMQSDLSFLRNLSLSTQFIGEEIASVRPLLARYDDVDSCEKSTSLANESGRPPISANRGFYFYETEGNDVDREFVIAREELVLSAAPLVCSQERDPHLHLIQNITQNYLNTSPIANFAAYHFWKEAVLGNRAVIMLSNLDENRAERYWPLPRESLLFKLKDQDSICVTSLRETSDADMDTKTFSVFYKNAETIHSHYLIKNWQNRDAVDSDLFLTIINIAKIVRSPIIHCSAGIGRTGVLYVGLQLQSLLKGFFATRILEAFNGETSLSAAAGVALQVVRNYLRPFVQAAIVCARKQRNIFLVETQKQEDFLVAYANHLMGQVAANFGLQTA